MQCPTESYFKKKPYVDCGSTMKEVHKPMSDEVIGRRKTLKYLGLLTASAAGREFLTSWLPAAMAAPTQQGSGNHRHQSAEPSAPAATGPYVPQFFKPEEYETVQILTEMIIPTDDQPGAREAQVARYLDFLVYSAAEFQPSLQDQWTQGLRQLDQVSTAKAGQPFRKLIPPEREKVLTEISLPEHDPQAHHPGFEFYRLVKEMTVEGFYTSRVGLIDVLGYQGLAYLNEFPGCTHPEHQS
jgi:gluconate 2-dehydrogenase gamma chain